MILFRMTLPFTMAMFAKENVPLIRLLHCTAREVCYADDSAVAGSCKSYELKEGTFLVKPHLSQAESIFQESRINITVRSRMILLVRVVCRNLRASRTKSQPQSPFFAFVHGCATHLGQF